MVFLKICIIYFIFLSFSYAEDKSNNEKYIGYLSDGMSEMKYKESQIAMKMWIHEFNQKYQLLSDIHYYDTSNNILNDLQNSKLEVVVLNPAIYLQNSKLIDSNCDKCWIVQRGDLSLEPLVLLTNRSKGILNMNHLKGKKVAIKNDNYMGNIFLEKEILKVTNKTNKTYLSELVTLDKSSTAILQTYFGKVDACVVPLYTYNLAIELNPAMKKHLITIAQSPPLYTPSVLFFHKNTSDEKIKKYEESFNHLKNSDRGQMILELFKMKSLEKTNTKQLEPLREYYKEYQDLLLKARSSK